VAFLELLLAVAAMGGWISKQVRYAPHTARRWAANLNGLSPEEAYAPLRRTPELFESLLRDEWLAPTLLDVVAAARRGQCHRDLREEAPGVFSFAMFSDAFCRDFLREVDGYMDSGLPIRRPNSMNNYGLIVNEIGMLNVISELQREVLWPIARSLWPKEGSAFHAHHSFMVQYRKTEDPGLDMHTDDSDVTFNVCLGEVFAGAGLTFCGGVGTPDHRQRAPASVEIVDAPGNPSQVRVPVRARQGPRGRAPRVQAARRRRHLERHAAQPHHLEPQPELARVGRVRDAHAALPPRVRRAGRALPLLHARPRLRRVQALPAGQGGVRGARLVPAAARVLRPDEVNSGYRCFVRSRAIRRNAGTRTSRGILV
jgi:hypothetical protein